MKDAERDAWTKKITRDEIQRSLARTKRQKYGAVKTDIHGKRFDSAKEAKRYLELAMLQAANEISELRLQPEFRIELPQAGTYNGMPPVIHICSYFADFSYMQRGEIIIEDVKSKATSTPLFRLKKKLVECLHGVTVREV